MNAQSKIEAPRFNPMEAYERERDENRRLYGLLTNVLFVAEGMLGELERKGVDVSHRRAIIANAKAARFEDTVA